MSRHVDFYRVTIDLSNGKAIRQHTQSVDTARYVFHSTIGDAIAGRWPLITAVTLERRTFRYIPFRGWVPAEGGRP